MRDRSGWGEQWLAEYHAKRATGDRSVPVVPFELTLQTAYKPRNRREEEELQAEIVKVWRPLLVPDARLLATNGELPGGEEQIPRAARRKKMGYWRGTSDLLARRAGALLWLEVKLKGSYPTDEQEEFGAWAAEIGDSWVVVRSVMAAGEALRAAGMLR